MGLFFTSHKSPANPNIPPTVAVQLEGGFVEPLDEDPMSIFMALIPEVAISKESPAEELKAITGAPDADLGGKGSKPVRKSSATPRPTPGNDCAPTSSIFATDPGWQNYQQQCRYSADDMAADPPESDGELGYIVPADLRMAGASLIPSSIFSFGSAHNARQAVVEEVEAKSSRRQKRKAGENDDDDDEYEERQRQTKKVRTAAPAAADATMTTKQKGRQRAAPKTLIKHATKLHGAIKKVLLKTDTLKCPFPGCRHTFDPKYTDDAVVTAHVKKVHKGHLALGPMKVSSSELPDKRGRGNAKKDSDAGVVDVIAVRCPVDGCDSLFLEPNRCPDDLYKNVGRHATVKHLAHLEYRCPWCNCVFERMDACKRHIPNSCKSYKVHLEKIKEEEAKQHPGAVKDEDQHDGDDGSGNGSDHWDVKQEEE